MEEALADLEERRGRALTRRAESSSAQGGESGSKGTPSSSSRRGHSSSNYSPNPLYDGQKASRNLPEPEEMMSSAPSCRVASTGNWGAEEEREAKAVVVPGGDSAISHFYQLSDGQYAFLHPLNMRCLMADAEGQHGRLPERVEGRVLEVEAMTLTPEIRSRYAFLKHLSLYSHVKLVELDLKPVLSEATYAQFRADIKKRQQRRKNKEKAEKREKKAASGSPKGLGLGLTEEELQEMKARREAVDLDGKGSVAHGLSDPRGPMDARWVSGRARGDILLCAVSLGLILNMDCRAPALASHADRRGEGPQQGAADAPGPGGRGHPPLGLRHVRRRLLSRTYVLLVLTHSSTTSPGTHSTDSPPSASLTNPTRPTR